MVNERERESVCVYVCVCAHARVYVYVCDLLNECGEKTVVLERKLFIVR